MLAAVIRFLKLKVIIWKKQLYAQSCYSIRLTSHFKFHARMQLVLYLYTLCLPRKSFTNFKC